MLAFTMQFSRYGRNHASRTSHPQAREHRPFEVAPCEAAASSGPNSVLRQPSVTGARSAIPPKREAY